MLPFTIIQAIQLVLSQGSECLSEAGVEKKKEKGAVEIGKYFPENSFLQQVRDS